LDDFPTHVAHMRFGGLVTGPVPWPITNDEHPLKDDFPIPTTLYNIALQWLKDDREFRCKLENQGKKLRGARRNEA
jgi:CCR4-NOT complex subunit CAF16